MIRYLIFVIIKNYFLNKKLEHQFFFILKKLYFFKIHKSPRLHLLKLYIYIIKPFFLIMKRFIILKHFKDTFFKSNTNLEIEIISHSKNFTIHTCPKFYNSK